MLPSPRQAVAVLSGRTRATQPTPLLTSRRGRRLHHQNLSCLRRLLLITYAPARLNRPADLTNGEALEAIRLLYLTENRADGPQRIQPPHPSAAKHTPPILLR